MSGKPVACLVILALAPACTSPRNHALPAETDAGGGSPAGPDLRADVAADDRRDGADAASAAFCGVADAVCPPGCPPTQDPDCVRGGGLTCQTSAQCRSGACTDGVCCTQSCGPCQSCLGAGGTCVDVPAGKPDDDPVASCGGDNRCDGKGACAPACRAPDVFCRTQLGAFAACGRTRWGFEDGIEGATSSDGPFELTWSTERRRSGAGALAATAGPGLVYGLSLRMCDRGQVGPRLVGKSASLYVYLDRPSPLPAGMIEFITSGWASEGTWGNTRTQLRNPPVGQWIELRVAFDDNGSAAQSLTFTLWPGDPAAGVTRIFLDDAVIDP